MSVQLKAWIRQVATLSDTALEEELKLIADEQKSNVEELVALVKENESILALMRVSCINLCDLIYSQHITQQSF